MFGRLWLWNRALVVGATTFLGRLACVVDCLSGQSLVMCDYVVHAIIIVIVAFSLKLLLVLPAGHTTNALAYVFSGYG